MKKLITTLVVLVLMVPSAIFADTLLVSTHEAGESALSHEVTLPGGYKVNLDFEEENQLLVLDLLEEKPKTEEQVITLLTRLSHLGELRVDRGQIREPAKRAIVNPDGAQIGQLIYDASAEPDGLLNSVLENIRTFSGYDLGGGALGTPCDEIECGECDGTYHLQEDILDPCLAGGAGCEQCCRCEDKLESRWHSTRF